tara:strand:+ start:449 stop:628 length:180 start_codon:yes stop_codon:yes gene_type:complete
VRPRHAHQAAERSSSRKADSVKDIISSTEKLLRVVCRMPFIALSTDFLNPERMGNMLPD